jgi:hypothetical protein
MQNSPVSVVVNGDVISELINFRYGQQLHDQQFFELKFKQPLFGSPFSFGTGDAESYINKPIKLNFKDSLGRLKSVSGTIVSLEFISSPGHQAEVVIAGTMYKPSGGVNKFSLFLVALLAFPLLFTGGLFLYVSNLGTSLVKTEGVVRSFEDRMGKGAHWYTFKIAPYAAYFKRHYGNPVLSSGVKDINELNTGSDGAFNANGAGQLVTFYVLKEDLPKLQSGSENVDFLYLHLQKKPIVKFDYYYDVLVYITDKTWFYFTWLFYMAIEIACLVFAFYCYKMYTLNQQLKNRLIWLTCITFAAIFNILLFSISIN